MLLGVIVMYGISFYTQTLLEITEGIQVSDIALQEISGRYEEGLESREIIENYYNERFLCTARLLSFIVEEDPTAMNTESDHYHSVLDAEGNRKYLLDDEGNRLRSISESELCPGLACQRDHSCRQGTDAGAGGRRYPASGNRCSPKPRGGTEDRLCYGE